MTTRKLLSKINYALNHIQYGEEERKDINKSFKLLKEKVLAFNFQEKLVRHLNHENENLQKRIKDLENINVKNEIILNIFKDYYNSNLDFSFDTFLTSNYSYEEVTFMKNFLGVEIDEKLFQNFELVIPKEQFNDELLSKIKVFKNYAYILHDKDLNSKPHYHIYVGGMNLYRISRISNFFNLHPNYIVNLKGSKEVILKYFIHDGLSDKHQYDKSELIKNF